VTISRRSLRRGEKGRKGMGKKKKKVENAWPIPPPSGRGGKEKLREKKRGGRLAVRLSPDNRGETGKKKEGKKRKGKRRVLCTSPLLFQGRHGGKSVEGKKGERKRTFREVSILLCPAEGGGKRKKIKKRRKSFLPSSLSERKKKKKENREREKKGREISRYPLLPSLL